VHFDLLKMFLGQFLENNRASMGASLIKMQSARKKKYMIVDRRQKRV